MRLGLILPVDSELTTLDDLADQAREAQDAGVETVWFASGENGDTSLLVAAAVAPQTTVLRLAACVPVGGHPLEIAESAAVADNCSNGRLILVLEDVTGDAELLFETVAVVLAAVAPRPFRHEGPRWTIPANLAENDQPEERIIVNPTVVSPELPIWLVGPAAARIARQWGLVHVSAGSAAEATDAWRNTDRELGPAAARLRRPALRTLAVDPDGNFDDDGLVESLRAEQRAWQLDTAFLGLPVGLADEARSIAVGRIASRVRPRVNMDQLPAGLERHWREVLS